MVDTSNSVHNVVKCLHEDCVETKALTRGLCRKHYQEARDLDLLDELPRLKRSARGEPAGFLRQHVVHQLEDCLVWPFARATRGYGQVWFEGRQARAHRVMCILAHGEPPFEGAEATHSCQNGHMGCVNPRHLRWKTHQENLAEAAAIGRQSRFGPRPSRRGPNFRDRSRSHPDLILE